MAIGRTNAGGGGLNKSVIIVTAPTGSTVTCKMGTTTKTASEKSGTWTFTGLDNGTWTITATKSGQTATKTVSITRLEVEYVTITYFSATINITYPAGSTCKATNGTTTLTAPDTSGTWSCKVPNSGTWKVTITNGSNTKSEDVSVSTNGQTLSVELAYGLVLFDNGDKNAVTGGWKGVSDSGAKVTIGDTILFTLVASSSRDAAAYTVNKIDCTKYSVLKVYVNVTSGSAFHVGATSANTSYVPTFVVDKKSTNSGEQIMTADISSLTGNFYICAYADATAATVSKIVLE